MLRDIWNGAVSKVDWHSVGFFAGELLAFYQALGESFTSIHLPRWMFATLLLRKAISKGYSSWDVQRDKVVVVFNRWQDRLKPEERQSLLNIIAGPSMPASSTTVIRNSRSRTRKVCEASGQPSAVSGQNLKGMRNE